MDKISKEKYDLYVKKMEQIALDSEYEPEHYHIEADDLMMKFLKELGFNELVNAYDKVSKWYA